MTADFIHRRSRPAAVLAVLLWLYGCGAATTSVATTAVPTTAASTASAQSGQYPNLFRSLGHPTPAVQSKIAMAFMQLFHGDPATQALYFADGQNRHGAKAYILDVNNNDVRSEGMSYGMMIALQLNKKAEFDALWNWAYSHMYQADPTHPAYGYFAWSVSTQGVANDEMPAPDGEEYFATALYFAATRWGDGTGINQYKAQADALLHQMRHRQVIRRSTARGEQSAGDLFDETHAMVRFTPDSSHADHTDASYHLPAFYEIWARLGPAADREFWRKAAAASRVYFSKAAHAKTGLTPEYGNFDGTPWAAPWRPDSVDFRFDAWRSAMNWSVDWSWWRANPDAVTLSTRLQNFFYQQGLDSYVSQYSLDGKKLDTQQMTGPTAGLVAMNAVASLASAHPAAGQFVTALWQQPIPTGRYRYYDGMLYLMGLLHVSGEFKAWLPPEAEPEERKQLN